jgi:hypothetical protein
VIIINLSVKVCQTISDATIRHAAKYSRGLQRNLPSVQHVIQISLYSVMNFLSSCFNTINVTSALTNSTTSFASNVMRLCVTISIVWDRSVSAKTVALRVAMWCVRIVISLNAFHQLKDTKA